MKVNNITPNPQAPVERKPANRLSRALAEFTQAAKREGIAPQGMFHWMSVFATVAVVLGFSLFGVPSAAMAGGFDVLEVPVLLHEVPATPQQFEDAVRRDIEREIEAGVDLAMYQTPLKATPKFTLAEGLFEKALDIKEARAASGIGAADRVTPTDKELQVAEIPHQQAGRAVE